MRSAAPSNLLRFIEFKYSNHELAHWNVGIITKSDGKNFQVNDAVSVHLVRRNQTPDSVGQPYYLIRKSHIISPNDEFIDLNGSEIAAAQEASRRLWQEKGKEGEPKRLNGDWVRNQIRKPDKVLLLLYFLDPEGADIAADAKPIVGFAISFPGSERDDAVSYAVHQQLLPIFNQEDLVDETDYDDED